MKTSDLPIALRFSGEVAAAGGLTRIPVATTGRWVKGKVKASLTPADLAKIVANFRARKTGDLVIDFDHGSEMADGSGNAPAAGWLKEIEDGPDADGILYGRAEFNETGAERLRKKEYRYVSPVVVWGARDPNTGQPQGTTVVSIALTNTPLMQELPAIAFSEGGWEIDRGDAVDKERRVIKKLIMADRDAGRVRAILEDDTETTLSVEGLEAPPKVIRFSDLKRGTDGKIDFSSVPHDGDTLIASDVLHAMEVEREVDAAVAAGKVKPAQRVAMAKFAFSDLEAFRGMVAGLPVAVDTGERGLAGTGAEKTGLHLVEDELAAAIKAKRTADPKLDYTGALKLVASEKPELMKRREKLMRAQVRTEEGEE